MKLSKTFSQIFNKRCMTVLAIVLVSCSDIDNYEEPNGTIYGTLTDAITNENFQSEQPDGFNIKLFEEGSEMNSPITFWGRPDGTFENAWIFQNEYQIVPTEGAFFPVETVVAEVDKETEVNFTVTPFLAVTNASVESSAEAITANYEIARTVAADKIIERKTLVSTIPTVNNVVFDYKQETDLSGMTDEDILSAQFTDELTSIPSGKYYVRVAVATDNALKRYNYSQIFEIDIQ